jgi:hypothetical protein
MLLLQQYAGNAYLQCTQFLHMINSHLFLHSVLQNLYFEISCGLKQILVLHNFIHFPSPKQLIYVNLCNCI